MLRVSRIFLDRHRRLRNGWWIAAFFTLLTIHLGVLLVTVVPPPLSAQPPPAIS